ncbi:hypothetical protein E4U43_007400 [Claviceps pusilla]|uniref:Uncharacterized protein n=1 Tax=Claviceps pusilla TaxID=123648 RepID=A0A9P7T3Q3_9HYPO|nr:hypothetical protein E4U43_007400 [Claviceps pusilla]
MSSNPFRKKSPETTASLRASSPKPSLRYDDHLAASDDRKDKSTKRVRVLSPPPSSSDALRWSHDGSQPPGILSDDNDTVGFSHYHPTSDPFGGTSTDESDRDSNITPPPVPPLQNNHGQERVRSHTTPVNPFSKTLQHAQGSVEPQTERNEEESEVPRAARAGRRSLNVDAFRSLLMTGRVGHDAASAPTQRHESTAEDKKSSTCPPVLPSNATPRTIQHNGDDSSQVSSYESQVEGDEESSNSASLHQTNKDRDRKLPPRPPPPPSSRHGKSLRQHGPFPDLSRGVDDVDDDAQLAMNRELDGGIPVEVEMEVNESQPQVESAAVRRDNTSKKSAPAPPPRRGHPRSDSQVADVEGFRQTCSAAGEPVSRSASTRLSGPVPAPPPSRRPHSARGPSSQLSGSNVSSPKTTARAPIMSMDHAVPASSPPSENPLDGNPPCSPPPHPLPPPPPPARQFSTRRPPSLNNMDAPTRRISSETRSREIPLVPPPPPPPRNRSGSGNNTAAALSKKSSEANLPAQHTADEGKSAGILADLDALQREVDALRGKMD